MLKINEMGEFVTGEPQHSHIVSCRVCGRLRPRNEIRDGICKECRIRLAIHTKAVNMGLAREYRRESGGAK